jgi:hypothetical protein|uniref:Uncharacterized protein n=1 Tax=Zea mays TaxID=4577 RepID=A0A804QJI7_MAIZE
MAISHEFKNLQLQATTTSTISLIKCTDQDVKTNWTRQLPACANVPVFTNRSASSVMVQLFQSQQIGKTNPKNHKRSNHAIVDDVVEKTEESSTHKGPDDFVDKKN